MASRCGNGVRTLGLRNEAILNHLVAARVPIVVKTWIAQSWGGALVLEKQLVDRKKEVGL
jgi:type IV secretory pathway TrbD component